MGAARAGPTLRHAFAPKSARVCLYYQGALTTSMRENIYTLARRQRHSTALRIDTQISPPLRHRDFALADFQIGIAFQRANTPDGHDGR